MSITKVGLVSLGCAKNRVDSENLLGMLAQRGMEIVADPAEADDHLRQHLRLHRVREGGVHRGHFRHGSIQKVRKASEAVRHRLSGPALSRRADGRDSRDRRHHGRGGLRAPEPDARRRGGRSAPLLHPKRRALPAHAAHSDHAGLFRLREDLRRLRQPLHLLRHSADPRRLRLAPLRRHRGRVPPAGRVGRDGADADCAGHVALRLRSGRREAAAAGAAESRVRHRGRALGARAVLLSRFHGR